MIKNEEKRRSKLMVSKPISLNLSTKDILKFCFSFYIFVFKKGDMGDAE